MPDENKAARNQEAQNVPQQDGNNPSDIKRRDILRNVFMNETAANRVAEVDAAEEEDRPLGRIQHWADDQEKRIIDVYGSTVKHSFDNAQKEALEAIKITPPEDVADIGETFISLVTMGASMNLDYVANLETTSTKFGASTASFNQSNVVSNIPKDDNRFLTKGFADALLRGRIDAAEAIEQYKQGNYEPVKKALRCLMEYAGAEFRSQQMHGSIGDTPSVVFGTSAMMDRLLSAKLPFSMDELLPEGEMATLKSAIYLHKVHHDTLERIGEFRQNPGAPGSAERQELLSHIAMGLNMTEFYNAEATANYQQGMALGEQLLQENGIDPDSEDFEELYNGQFNICSMTAMQLQNLHTAYGLTDLEYIYSRPDAEQWIAKRYLDQITATPAYQAALNEPDPEKLAERIAAIATDANRNQGIRGYADQRDFTLITDERARLADTMREKFDSGMEDMRQFVRDAIKEYREVKSVRDMLTRNAKALAGVPAAEALRAAAVGLDRSIENVNRPILRRMECQEGMREVTRLAAAYVRSVQEKAGGAKGEDWEPSNPAERAAYRAAKELQSSLAPRIEPRPEEVQKPAYTVERRDGMRASERREIERSMELFAAIPETNTDKAISELLRREERFRAEHAMEQGALMASGVRTMMLLAARKRFPIDVNETAAERAHRHVAMKEALSPERVMNNMLAICVDMSYSPISPIEGVILTDGYNAISAAFIDREDGSFATTEDIRERMEREITYVKPYDPTAGVQPAFYAGSAAFEESFLNEGQPLPQQHAEAYTRVQEAFRGLNETLAPFYERNEEGELPTLTEADFVKIREGYQNVLTEMNAYMTEMSQTGHPLDMRHMELMQSFREKMGQDMVTMEAGRQMGLSTLPNLMLSGDMPTAEIAGVPEIYGDFANARMRVTLPGNDGVPVEGFFTATNSVPVYHEESFAEMVDKHTAGHPEWKELIENIFEGKQTNKKLTSDIKDHELDIKASVDQSALFDRWMAENRPQLAEQYRRCRGHEFSLALVRFAKEHSNQMLLSEEYVHQGVNSGNHDKRNSAMSTMAELMKMSGAVAPARSVKVRIGGRELTGTFMELADGEDLSRVRKGDPLEQVRVEDMLTPQSVSSVADLQVLDYVCGNVDRHNMNMLYQMDTSDPLRPKCVGVQGIDNDFSFCAHANGKSMADIMNMKIIRKETAEALFSLKPEMLKTVLGGYDLSQEETFAALKRIGELKQAVENGTLRMVTDEQIKNMNYQTELLAGGNNYFDQLIRVPFTARRQAFVSDGATMDKAYQGLNANTTALGRCYDGLVEANRGRFIGSKEYKAVLKGMEDLMAHRNELLQDRDPERVALYEHKLSELRRNVTRYLIKKAEEARHGKPSKLAERRVAQMKAFSAKLRVEESHIQDYREAEANLNRNLDGSTRQQTLLALQKKSDLEIDRYLAKGAARELFPRLANRKEPLLAEFGAILKEDADVVFAKAGEPDTPEMLERKERLYAGLIVNRMIERQMEQPDGAGKLRAAWENDPTLFERMRVSVMLSPAFNKESAHDIDSTLKADTAQYDNMIKRIEQAAQAKADAPEKQNEQKAPQAEKKAPDMKKAPVAPMA